MAQIRYVPDKDRPSVAVEIPLQKPLPDYDLEELEQPTPRDVDGILVTQGFRDLVDDARGMLTDLVVHPPAPSSGVNHATLALAGNPYFEITQLTGAICPGDEEVYRPGLWIVLKDVQSPPNKALTENELEHVRLIANTLAKKLNL